MAAAGLIRDPACLYLYVSWSTYRQHSNWLILYVCAKRYIQIQTSYRHVCIRYIHVCIQYRQYRMCMYLLECVCMWFWQEQYCVCIEPVWWLYSWNRYKQIHTCLYFSCILSVSCLYPVYIWPVSCLYFSASCCIFQFADLWMLAARSHCCSITNASCSHHARIALASRSHCGCWVASRSLSGVRKVQAAWRLHWNQLQQRALGKATKTTLVDGAVELLWLDALAKPNRCRSCQKTIREAKN